MPNVGGDAGTTPRAARDTISSLYSVMTPSVPSRFNTAAFSGL
jgi:hypothetical protein